MIFAFNPEALDFVDYVDSFYNEKTGLYPIIGLTPSMVLAAFGIYQKQLAENKNLTWGHGDSVDRERVRDIILQTYNVKFA